MYSLEQIFESSKKDFYSVRLDGLDSEGFLLYGIKIVKYHKDERIVILNTLKNGEFYEEVSRDEYAQFHINGWRLGVYDIAIVNYLRKIKMIEERSLKDPFDNQKYTASLLNQLELNQSRLQSIEEKKWKAIITKS
jgi:hypothetical protein